MSADLVLAGGRVIDPLSGLDEVADVAVRSGRVVEIGPALQATARLDVAGLVVSPGFIDLHSHVHSIAGHRLQAFDGVTTALDLEAGASPVSLAYEIAAQEGRPLNYGFSASWASLRIQLLAGVPADGQAITMLHNLGLPEWQRSTRASEQRRLVESLESELADGALGVGVLVGYAPGTEPDEYLAVARMAAAAGRPVFTHARELVEADPQVLIDGPTEIVQAAAETGARMHFCHINSSSRRHVERVLDLVDEARCQGAQLTTEAYPYGSGATAIGAAFLAPELLGRWEITPSSIIYLPTGERVADEARLRDLREQDPGGLAVFELLDERNTRDSQLLASALLHPDTMVATDAMPIFHSGAAFAGEDVWPLPHDSVTHPRAAGTFARTLRMYVRERAELSLAEAIRRSSTLPAQLLERVCSAMRRKGRLQVGADADIVVFDPDRVSDQATYQESCRPSTGFAHVLVNGIPVVKDGQLDRSAMPGRPVRAS
jgi:cytosine/adenosine deaminase-related metal-dependent hydrolase